MPQFKEVNEIYNDENLYEKTRIRLLNKNFISDIQNDPQHNQIMLKYNNEEIRIRDEYEIIKDWVLEES